MISFLLLLFLAFNFARGAWQVAHAHRSVVDQPVHRPSVSRGYFLGLILALTSPWNVGFWFAVVGGQGAAQGHTSFLGSLTLAAAVVSGAIAWTIVLCTALKLGARIFARPAWQVGTQAVSALVMLVFAARLVWLWRVNVSVVGLRSMSDRDKKLTINEIYFSVQGESTWAGLPCVFVRLTFCDLRCNLLRYGIRLLRG